MDEVKVKWRVNHELVAQWYIGGEKTFPSRHRNIAIELLLATWYMKYLISITSNFSLLLFAFYNKYIILLAAII